MTDTQNWRNTDPATSLAAGVSASQTFRTEHQRKIYAVIAASVLPVSAEQIADALGWDSHVPVNRRLSELVDAKLITVVDSNYRNRKSGKAAQRYTAITQP